MHAGGVVHAPCPTRLQLTSSIRHTYQLILSIVTPDVCEMMVLDQNMLAARGSTAVGSQISGSLYYFCCDSCGPKSFPWQAHCMLRLLGSLGGSVHAGGGWGTAWQIEWVLGSSQKTSRSLGRDVFRYHFTSVGARITSTKGKPAAFHAYTPAFCSRWYRTIGSFVLFCQMQVKLCRMFR
ncbi:unnamed protein product, partial [Ectocarpus fasciculatus]